MKGASYCNARKRGRSKLDKAQPGPWAGDGYCKSQAGKGTDHLGIGRCKHHGGATPIKHGLYSKVTRQSLGELIAEEQKRVGVSLPELGDLLDALWEAVCRHVDDPETEERFAAEWIRALDDRFLFGPGAS